METISDEFFWDKQTTLHIPHIINESHSLCDSDNHTSFPNDNLASNHQNCETTSDVALKYVTQILFDENINENINAYPEEEALQSVEKSFYDILEQEYPPSSNNPSLSDDSCSTRDIKIESLSILQFKRGMEEGTKFLPSIDGNNYWFQFGGKKDGEIVGRESEGGKKEDGDPTRSKGKKHANGEELANLEGPKYKISTIYFKDPAMDEMYDKVLLLHGCTKAVVRLNKIMQSRTKRSTKKEIHMDSVDLRTLLLHCSQTIAMNDTRSATELIKQIRKYSSPDGDGLQRMAHIFANALEARLAGTGNELCRKPISTRENVIDILKADHLSTISIPFIRASNFFANCTILKAIRKATKLHIIHFGIDFGFQWPHLMRALSERIIKAPKLRITGIDDPQPGFRPNETIDEAGRRLQEYAKRFGIPFEYKGIGTKWNKICIEDLNIEKDELVIVNSLYRFENLGDEMDVMHSPRNQVLDIIRQIKPHIFIKGIINGSFSEPLFAPRFKQVLLHYSAMFDLLDCTVPSNNKQRHFIENKIWAYDVFNLVAREGSKVVERPETYKHWEVRNLRAGFEQLPIDHSILNKMKKRVTKVYNKNFFIEDDKNWLLMGWREEQCMRSRHGE